MCEALDKQTPPSGGYALTPTSLDYWAAQKIEILRECIAELIDEKYHLLAQVGIMERAMIPDLGNAPEAWKEMAAKVSAEGRMWPFWAYKRIPQAGDDFGIRVRICPDTDWFGKPLEYGGWIRISVWRKTNGRAETVGCVLGKTLGEAFRNLGDRIIEEMSKQK